MCTTDELIAADVKAWRNKKVVMGNSNSLLIASLFSSWGKLKKTKARDDTTTTSMCASNRH